MLQVQVLVGTGYKNMTIVKIKTLKVYAFGFCKFFFSPYLDFPIPFEDKKKYY
jgi:hypothetical protein